MQQPDLLEVLGAPIEHGVDLVFLDHRAAEDVARLLIDEFRGDVGGDGRPGHQRNLGLLKHRREGRHVAAVHGADHRGNLVVADQPLHQRYRPLRIGLVIVDDELDFRLRRRSLVFLERKLVALQVGFAEVAGPFHPQAAHVDLFPLRRGRRRRTGLGETGQLNRRGAGRGRLAPQQSRQIFPARLQPADLRLVEFTQRGDHALPRTSLRAIRLAQIPITVADASDLFVFSPQKHRPAVSPKSVRPTRGCSALHRLRFTGYL
ncbi:hypothetical protein GALL_529480 [mine drainage metagenome]|uniref:Uncharacterized protein n=1 Tax=mine drainage metagenome TaxID=410659 RepID=A0A1J5PDA2_9ZZZZ